MRHTIGQIAGLESIPGQLPHQFQRSRAGINEYKVIGIDELRCRPGDAAFLLHRQCLLSLHGGFVRQKAAVRQRGTAMHLVQPAHPVKLCQVATDGRLTCIQSLAQLLHRYGSFTVQLFQDQAEAFFCQHLHPPFAGFYLTVYDRL